MKFKDEIKPIIFLLFITCIFFWKILVFRNYMVYPAQDVIEQHSVWKFLISDTFRTFKQLPFWNPHYFSGQPFVGNVLTAVFYPINFLYLFFNTDLLFGYIFLLDIFLIGAFTYVFSRELGLDRKSALFSAIIFMFNGNLILNIFAGDLNYIDVMVWVPLSFLFTELLIKKKKIIYTISLGLFLGTQILAGYTQFSFYTFFILGIYFLIRSFQIYRKNKEVKNFLRIFYMMVLAGIISILISSVQLIPSFQFLRYSPRSHGLSFEDSSIFSLPPYQLISFLIPEIFGLPLHRNYWGGRNFHELCGYIGVISIILAFFGLLFKRNKYSHIFLVLLIFSLLFSFGKYTPFFYIFYKFIPGFNLFRGPSKYLFVYEFSISILSGIGFSFLFSKDFKKHKRTISKFLIIFLIFALLGISSLLVVINKKDTLLQFGEKILIKKYEEQSKSNVLYPIEEYKNRMGVAYFDAIRSSSIFLLICLVSIFLILFRIKNIINLEILQTMFIIFLLFDIWLFSMKYIQVIKPEEIFVKSSTPEFDLTDILERLKGDSKFRVYTSIDWLLPQHITARKKLEITEGYDLAQLSYYSEFIEKMSKDGEVQFMTLLKLLNVKYAVSHHEIDNEDLRLIYHRNKTIKMMPRYFFTRAKYEVDEVYVYENKKFLSRAYIVPNAKIVKGKNLIFNELQDRSFDPRKIIILEDDPEKPLYNKAKFKEALITFHSPNKIIIEVNLTKPGYLVLSEIWYPSWKAYDNGKETKIFKTDYILRSVYLEEGNHRVEFVYDSSLIKIGFLISFSTFVIVTLFLCKKLNEKNSEEWLKQ